LRQLAEFPNVPAIFIEDIDQVRFIQGADGNFAIRQGCNGDRRVNRKGTQARAVGGIDGDKICGAVGDVDLAGGADIEVFREGDGFDDGFGAGNRGGRRGTRADSEKLFFLGVEGCESLRAEHVGTIGGVLDCADAGSGFGEQLAPGGEFAFVLSGSGGGRGGKKAESGGKSGG
jgi:hypothetical protein